MLPFPELQTTAGKDHNSQQKKTLLFDFSFKAGILKPNARPPRNSRTFLFLSPMARMSFVALFALALSGVASAAPALGDLRARAFQTFTPCVPIPGTCVFACRFQPAGFNVAAMQDSTLSK